MKFYLASSFQLKDKVSEIDRQLHEKGHTVTVPWWLFDFKSIRLPDDEWYCEQRVIGISRRNFNGIKEADVFLLITSDKEARKFNGANVELGFALALGKPCYSLGKLERSAMYCPVTKCASLDEVLSKISVLTHQSREATQ